MTGSYRYIDPDQPDYNEGSCQSWHLDSDIAKEENLLIVTEGSIAECYVKLFGLDLARVGGVSCDDMAVDVMRGEKVTLVSCSGHETGNIGHVLLSLTNPDTCSVLVLTARHVSQLRCEDGVMPSNVYCLATKRWTDARPCPGLPSPNIISGLSSSLLTEGQISGSKVLSIIAFTEILRPDSLSLEPLTVVHKIGEEFELSYLSLYFICNADAVTKAGLKKPINISNGLIQLKLFNCPDNIYM